MWWWWREICGIIWMVRGYISPFFSLLFPPSPPPSNAFCTKKNNSPLLWHNISDAIIIIILILLILLLQFVKTPTPPSFPPTHLPSYPTFPERQENKQNCFTNTRKKKVFYNNQPAVSLLFVIVFFPLLSLFLPIQIYAILWISCRTYSNSHFASGVILIFIIKIVVTSSAGPSLRTAWPTLTPTLSMSGTLDRVRDIVNIALSRRYQLARGGGLE